MLTRLAIRIQERFNALTPREQSLASYILDHQHEVIGFSATDLARGAGVSKSTAARFFRSLGYDSFDAVRRQAREELNWSQPILGSTAAPRAEKAGSAQAYLTQEVTNLTRSLEGLSSDTLRAASETLAGAGRVWVAALGDDAPLAAFAVQLFSGVRDGVQLLTDGSVPLELRLASLAPNDAVLLFALPPRPPALTFIIRQAEAADSRLVVLSDTASPPLAAAAAVVRCHVWADRDRRSLTPVVSILQHMALRLALQLGSRATNRRQLIDSLREGRGNGLDHS
jgi:DNA-binding MurR/RpiR family transcriptional regulator